MISIVWPLGNSHNVLFRNKEQSRVRNCLFLIIECDSNCCFWNSRSFLSIHWGISYTCRVLVPKLHLARKALVSRFYSYVVELRILTTYCIDLTVTSPKHKKVGYYIQSKGPSLCLEQSSFSAVVFWIIFSPSSKSYKGYKTNKQTKPTTKQQKCNSTFLLLKDLGTPVYLRKLIFVCRSLCQLFLLFYFSISI